ncbi:hypothetical protein Tco_1325760 [Tanacetum coccineum]
MSTLAHIDSETISQTNGARSSRVPIPLLDDPYMAVRQAYLATITDSESEPFEDFRETEIPQPLPIASSPVLTSDDPYLIVGQAHTPTTIDFESEPVEAPSGTFDPILDTETEDDESEAKGASSENKESEDKGPDSEGDEAAPEGQQQQATPVEVRIANRPLGLGYGAARRRALEIAEEITPSTFKIG